MAVTLCDGAAECALVPSRPDAAGRRNSGGVRHLRGRLGCGGDIAGIAAQRERSAPDAHRHSRAVGRGGGDGRRALAIGGGTAGDPVHRRRRPHRGPSRSTARAAASAVVARTRRSFSRRGMAGQPRQFHGRHRLDDRRRSRAGDRRNRPARPRRHDRDLALRWSRPRSLERSLALRPSTSRSRACFSATSAACRSVSCSAGSCCGLPRDGHLAAAVILPLYYLADATITLIRRVIRREPFWQAHRSISISAPPTTVSPFPKLFDASLWSMSHWRRWRPSRSRRRRLPCRWPRWQRLSRRSPGCS